MDSDHSPQFSYKVDFRYKKFRNDLKVDLLSSQLVVSVEEQLPDPLQRHWTTIIRELNPEYFNIEIVRVTQLND